MPATIGKLKQRQQPSKAAATSTGKTSLTSTEKSSHSSSFTPIAREYLTPLLPRGFQRYFDFKQAGRNYGIAIICPECGETPPTTYRDKLLKVDVLLSHYRRVRWMMAHIATHLPVKLVRPDRKKHEG